MKAERGRVSLLALTLLMLPVGAWGCVATDSKDKDKGSAGSSASGASASEAGSSGASTSMAGSSASGGAAAGGDPLAVACTTPTEALLTDFTYMATDAEGNATSPSDATFGDFTTTFSGGTYVFPGASMMYPMTSDVTMDNWHVTGDVGDYSGMGLFYKDCAKIDASAYKGISFTISGSVEQGGVVTLSVGTAADDVTSEWLNANKMTASDADKHTFGRCVPPGTNQYDGTCLAPTKTIMVTDKPTSVTVLWSDLKGGKPEASVNPSEISTIAWAFPAPPGVGTADVTTYKVDVTIDDLSFVE